MPFATIETEHDARYMHHGRGRRLRRRIARVHAHGLRCGAVRSAGRSVRTGKLFERSNVTVRVAVRIIIIGSMSLLHRESMSSMSTIRVQRH